LLASNPAMSSNHKFNQKGIRTRFKLALTHSNLFSQLSDLLVERASEGNADDIWSVIGLDRNEVRTARVLTWLLDPHGSHGFKESILFELWQQIPFEKRPFEPEDPLRSRRETIPLGDAQNRVDIEIEGKDFLLIIEVKIDAGEQPDQLQRYIAAAKAKAAARNLKNYCVLYLTRNGGTAVPEGCVNISWVDVARAIEMAAAHRPATAMGTQLARAFAAHVRKL
jgi:hypothetical protein